MEINHKSVFVLDHTQYFSISSENFIDLDFLKSKSHADIASITNLSKSLWTSSVESSVEYCRIVWDLFPQEKLIRFMVSDTAAHIVNTWLPNTQNINHVLNAMSMVGTPVRTTTQPLDYSVIHGLRAAVEALTEPSEQQKEALQLAEERNEKVLNKGRVICITSARDNKSMNSLEEIFHTVLVQQSALADKQPELLPVDNCHLVIINVVPKGRNTLVSNKDLREMSGILSSEIHSICASDISNKLTHLILSHYDLASTTVTGIPMKEEQNANSSANYDVEILHPRNSHTIICGSELLLPTSKKENAEYDTVTLKWCTPRGCGASDMQPCLAQHRVTPVDVTSRPSSCLINFLLNGRSVLLEMPRKTGGKLTSHLLSARGGEIFIHTLQITRTCLEDTPSISEGNGGRVTDYRIGDFSSFIRSHKLIPHKPLPDYQPDVNLLKARTKLWCKSRYYPITLGSTIVYNIRPHLDYLLDAIEKDELNETEVNQCRQNIFQILGMATRQDSLPLPNIGHKLKGNKKEEQYRLLWSELELLIKSSGTSAGHKRLIHCIQDCRSKNGDTNTNRSDIIRETTDSPLSPPHVMDVSHVIKNKRSNNRTLYDIVIAAERQKYNRVDFAGRLCTPLGQIAKLYANIKPKETTKIDSTIESHK